MKGIIAATPGASDGLQVQHSCGHVVEYQPTPPSVLSRRWEDVTAEACPACKSMSDLNATIVGEWSYPPGEMIYLEGEK